MRQNDSIENVFDNKLQSSIIYQAHCPETFFYPSCEIAKCDMNE